MRRWLSSLVPLGTFISSASACAAMCSVSTTRPTGYYEMLPRLSNRQRDTAAAHSTLLHNTQQNRIALSICSIMLAKGIYYYQNCDKTK